MELMTIKEIATICVIFTYAISMLVDSYVKVKSTKSKNHPKSRKGGNKK